MKLEWLLLVVVALAGPLSGHAAAQKFEAPSDVAAASVLPPELRAGQDFSVKDPVRHDGLVYTFEVESSVGRFSAEGTERLRALLVEIKAIGALQELKGSETFREAASKSGKNALKGMKELVTSPVETLKQAGSGLGRMFKRTGESFRSDKSEAEDSTLKSVLGVSKIKREYAKHLGVDPYSTNAVLQAELDEVSWTAFSGGLGIAALTAVVPGAAGAFVGFSGKANMLQDKLYATSPEDLRMENRKALVNMGVDKDLANAFIDNTKFSPTDQTLLVGALDGLPETAGRSVFVGWATATPDSNLAFVRRRVAEMFRDADAQNPLKEFRLAGPVPAAIDSRGNAIVCLPADTFLWSAEVAPAVDEVTREIGNWKGVKNRILVLRGFVSPPAREELAKRGWTVRENQSN